MIYKIANWSKIYENHRSRSIKTLNWHPIPNDLSSDFYTLIITQKNGPAMYGAWCSILHLASKCNPRGTLVRESGTIAPESGAIAPCHGATKKDGIVPHNCTSISRITRIPICIVEETIDFCIQESKVLIFDDIQTKRQNPALERHVMAKKGLRREGKGSIKNKNIYIKFDHLSLTQKDFEILKKDYTKDEIDKTIENIRNYKDNTNYTNLRHTVKFFLERKDENNERKPGEFKL